MNKHKPSIFSLIIGLILVTFSLSSTAEITGLSSALNKAGSQRMLSQRIVATYCQTGMNIKAQKSRSQLEKAISRFDQQLKELKAFRPKGLVNQQLVKVSLYWKPMRDIAKSPVDRSKAGKLRELAEDVLSASHKAVTLLQDEAGNDTGRLVNISGRQRMLSQRMSNLYMLQSWGLTSPRYSDDYSLAISEFKGALTELQASKLNTYDIDRALKKARKQFAVLERSLTLKDGEYIPLLIKMSTDKLLAMMNNVTQMYEQLANEEMLEGAMTYR